MGFEDGRSKEMDKHPYGSHWMNNCGYKRLTPPPVLSKFRAFALPRRAVPGQFQVLPGTTQWDRAHGLVCPSRPIGSHGRPWAPLVEHYDGPLTRPFPESNRPLTESNQSLISSNQPFPKSNHPFTKSDQKIIQKYHKGTCFNKCPHPKILPTLIRPSHDQQQILETIRKTCLYWLIHF